MSALPRLMTLPITMTSGFNANCAGSYPLINSMPSAASCSDMGGYTF